MRPERGTGAKGTSQVYVKYLLKYFDLIFLVACEDAGAIDERVRALVRCRKCRHGGIIGHVECCAFEPSRACRVECARAAASTPLAVTVAPKSRNRLVIAAPMSPAPPTTIA